VSGQLTEIFNQDQFGGVQIELRVEKRAVVGRGGQTEGGALFDRSNAHVLSRGEAHETNFRAHPVAGNVIDTAVRYIETAPLAQVRDYLCFRPSLGWRLPDRASLTVTCVGEALASGGIFQISNRPLRFDAK
jgi:hypothetical protein